MQRKTRIHRQRDLRAGTPELTQTNLPINSASPSSPHVHTYTRPSLPNEYDLKNKIKKKPLFFFAVVLIKTPRTISRRAVRCTTIKKHKQTVFIFVFFILFICLFIYFSLLFFFFVILLLYSLHTFGTRAPNPSREIHVFIRVPGGTRGLYGFYFVRSRRVCVCVCVSFLFC